MNRIVAPISQNYQNGTFQLMLCKLSEWDSFQLMLCKMSSVSYKKPRKATHAANVSNTCAWTVLLSRGKTSLGVIIEEKIFVPQYQGSNLGPRACEADAVPLS